MLKVLINLQNLEKKRIELGQKIAKLEQEVAEQSWRFNRDSQNEQQEFTQNKRNEENRLNLEIQSLESKIKESVEIAEKICPESLLSLPWSDEIWHQLYSGSNGSNGYQPRLGGLAPGILRVGTVSSVNHREKLPEPIITEPGIPALVPIRAMSSNTADKMPGHLVIFSNNAESRQAAVAAIQSIALRIICTFPVRKLKGIFIDPVSMGNNFPFKELPDFISGLKTYTRSDDIREQLRALTVHIEQVIQNYLGRNYDTIEAFNAAKSSVEEPYRYLFLADFPTNFESASWEDLKSLLVNGSKAGVYAIVHVDESDESQKPKRDMNYNLFESYCTVLRPSGMKSAGRQLFQMQLPNGCLCQVDLDEPPLNQQFNQLTGAIAKAFKEVKTETVSFTEFYPSSINPDKIAWSVDYNSGREVRAPIGVMGARENLEFWLGTNEDALVVSQSLLAGKPGAGKSYTLHAIILSLALRYSPDELQMYLLDFKEGVEFQIYVDPERSEILSYTEELNEEKALPHARVVSIESDREFGLSVLQNVQAEIEQRGSQFKSVGVSSLTDYRQKRPDVKMPRILVVIDEFQYMFQDRDKITAELNLIFEDITRRGRAFGVHLLIASQSPNVPNMSRGIYSFIELRMAQQMDKNTAASVLAEGNIDAVDLLEKPGKVIYNKDFGRKGHNEIGQVADMSLSERIKALLEVQNTARDIGYQRSEPLVLFNGSRPTKLSHNRQLRQLSQMSGWLSSRDLNKQVIQEPDWLGEETPGVAWLGEAMRIGDHTKAIFRRRSRSNMLLVGTSEEIIFGIISGILLSLVHTYEPQQAEFQIIDLCQDSEDNSWAAMSLNFRRLFAQYFPTAIGKRFPKPGDKILRGETVLQNVYEELERRQKQRDENPDELNLGPSLFLVYAIGSLSRAQNLRPIVGRRNEEPSEDAEKLLALAARGPELGIHSILWLDSLKTFTQLTADNRSALTNFDLRVGLNMPGDDSRLLLGETDAQSLPRMMAYFCDKSTGNNLEKFKAYSVPSIAEMAEYSKQFQHRSF